MERYPKGLKHGKIPKKKVKVLNDTRKLKVWQNIRILRDIEILRDEPESPGRVSFLLPACPLVAPWKIFYHFFFLISDRQKKCLAISEIVNSESKIIG